MLLPMSDKLAKLFEQCQSIYDLAESGDIENASHMWEEFQTKLESFFSEAAHTQYSELELIEFQSYFNTLLQKLSLKKVEIQNDITGMVQVRSNKVTKTYLTK